MSASISAPESSVLRLSRYHCFVGELLRSPGTKRLTSHGMAEELGVSEETVRRDLSFVDVEGRPGSGYDPAALYEALARFLGLTASYPFVAVGSREMLDALTVIFPADAYGLRPVAYFSEREEDAGSSVRDLEVRHLSEIPRLDPGLEATVALVACEPGSVDEVVDLLYRAGIRAILMLTPVLRPRHPDGMDVTYFRIPCALKALASAVPKPTCCATPCATAPCAPGVS